ncbi:MFS transporter [Pantoea sp. 1.19]|uniref:MFS transporter n=1 Tax=Pantoea sp. 1.19 TaxID=1925589 RepID=UPI000948F4D6|nr:MFS transporter [Pantoea sp. 1.19]
MSTPLALPSARTTPDAVEEQAWKKAVWRILPILMISYVMAYLDRINVGVAKLQMSSDLAFSETVYGLGAGIFFIGFFFFQIPSNMALHRFGARRLLGILLISWAFIAPLTAFVTTAGQFYAVRFLLGLAESGFYPGVILYLSGWFPTWRRGKMFALFATAVPLSGVLGGPFSGWIMEYFHQHGGLAGWKWLFIIQGTPSLLVGLLVLWLLTDRIEQAHWLSAEEQALLTARLREDNARQPAIASAAWQSVFRSGKVWLLTFIYFCLIAGFYTVSFWLPTLVSNAGVDDVFTVGLLTAIPYAAAIVTMLLASRSADRHRERRWHLAAIAVLGGVGMIISALFSDNLWIAMGGLTLGAAGALSTLPLFWSLPTAFLGGATAAVGIALINSFGNLAGFLAPWMMGLLADLTHSTLTGMLLISATLFVGAAAIFFIPGRLVNR